LTAPTNLQKLWMIQPGNAGSDGAQHEIQTMAIPLD
jgi:hypothetical protein